MLKCPKGTYETRDGSSECQQCPGGYFCDQEGTIDPTECPLKYYCPAGASDKMLCPDGTIGAKTKLKSDQECSLCPTGHYCL